MSKDCESHMQQGHGERFLEKTTGIINPISFQDQSDL